jgi:hypothetical protein
LPQSHRQAFVSFLLDRLGMETLRASEVTDRLSPLFDIAESDDAYPLLSVNEFNPAALASQMRELTGRVGIRRVGIHSCRVLRDDPTEQSIAPLYAEECFTTTSGVDVAGSVLVETIVRHIVAGCEAALERSFKDNSEGHRYIPPPNWEIVRMATQNIFQLVLSYCCAAIADDRERMDTLDMTIAFLGSVIPLGVVTKGNSVGFLYLGA